jgi:Tfp pilus assembly protein PilF
MMNLFLFSFLYVIIVISAAETDILLFQTIRLQAQLSSNPYPQFLLGHYYRYTYKCSLYNVNEDIISFDDNDLSDNLYSQVSSVNCESDRQLKAYLLYKYARQLVFDNQNQSKLLETFPYSEYAGMLNDLALMTYEDNKRDLAVQIYTEAIDNSPNFSSPIANLAALEGGRGNISGAIYLYERALSLSPDSDVLNHNYGSLCMEINHKKKAKKLFLKSISININMYYAKSNLATMHCMEGELEESNFYYKEAVENAISAGDFYSMWSLFFQQKTGIILVIANSEAD